jgi:tetratricopeptide (TPR) repeat protein
LKILSALLLNNRDFNDIIVSTDSIALILNYPKTDRYHAIRCLGNIAIFAQYRNFNQAIAKNSLYDAADILLKRLNRPEDARLLYKLGIESDIPGAEKYLEIVETYIAHDKPFEKILNLNWYTFDKKEKLEYIKKLKKYLKENPNTLLKPRIENILGDVYYSLYQFRAMKKWYERTIVSDPYLKRNSPAGYRINWGKKKISNQNFMLGSYIFIFIVYLTIIIVILPGIIKNIYRFSFQFFIKRILLFSTLFFGLSVIIFLVDFKVLYPDIQTILDQQIVIKTRPIISFPAIDKSFFPDCIIIFLLGYLPLFSAIFLQSFRDAFSRPFLFSLVLLLTLSIWAHYLLGKSFKYALFKDTVITKSHIFFDGELEVLLQKNPKKIFKVHPDLMSTNNSNLLEFIEKTYPDGIEKYKQ